MRTVPRTFWIRAGERWPYPTPLPVEPHPTAARLVGDALVDLARDLCVHLPRLVRRALAVRRQAKASPAPILYRGERAAMLDSSYTPFSGPQSRRRSFHFTTVSFDHAKEIRSLLGCSINDVVLATAAGATRRYLAHHRALPGLPTIAGMPASIRDESERGQWGNRITFRSLTFPTHIDDPILRLRAAADVASEAKADLALRRGANLEDWLRWLPPFAPKLLSRVMRIYCL